MQKRVVLTTALALAACDANLNGNTAATLIGDTSRLLERGSPTAAVRENCDPGLEPAPSIRRQPYLQQVTASSAMIGWVTTTPLGEEVAITRPDGVEVATVGAEPQASKQRRPDETQMWARVTGLEPGTIYCYAIQRDGSVVAKTGFRTAPAADDPAPIRFLAFGDSGGGGSDQYMLRDRMLEVPYDLIVHTGDVAYERGTLAQFEDHVFAVYQDIFKNVPFFPVPGNHDYKTDRARPYREVFALPGDSGERWYSYDWGRIHFAALDTNQDYATQAAWLDRDLAASRAPWKIVYTHAPLYSSGNHGSDTKLRKLIAPILEKHGVQLVLSGHDHHYERTLPQRGTAYVVTGGGGRGTYHVNESRFTAFADSVIHFLVVEVGTEQLVLHAIDATGVEFDSMVVPRA